MEQDRRRRQETIENQRNMGIAGGVIGTVIAGLGLGYMLSKLFSGGAVVQETRKQQQKYTGTALQVLEQVSRNIKLQKDDMKEKNELIIKLIRMTVIQGLKADPLFNKLYQDIVWTGSYYEGLKISNPDEFDLNIIISLPVKQSDLEVTTKNAPTAYVCINNFYAALQTLKNNKNIHWEIYKKMEEWCDEKGSLRQDKIRMWLESLLDKYINKHREEIMKTYNLQHFRQRKSGPALTLEFNNVSVDLVPAIEFKPSMAPPQPFRKLPERSALPWYAVPKPVPGRNNVWRLSFCKHEQQLIQGLERLKPAIRIIKKLRDTLQCHSVCSYFIKTVAYWELHNKRIKPNSNLDVVFFQLLRQLQTCIQENDLKSYWDPRYNLLSGIGDEERLNIAHRLKNVINSFERNMMTNPAMIGDLICPYP